MATISFSFTVPNDKKAQIISDFALQNGYQAEILVNGVMTINPQTKSDFSRQVVLRFIKDSVKAYRATIDAKLARDQAMEVVDQIEFT